MAGPRNNFDFLRICAALMVVHGHGWVLSGGAGPGLWGVPFARVGLDVFFSISGYLITTSWLRSPDLNGFLVRRARRILPGLAGCVLVTMFVIGPAATRLPPGAYFGADGTWRYLANIALYNQLYLPGVFEASPEPGAVNGSLWSLLPEVLCYLTVPLAAVACQGRARRHAALLCGLALLSGGLSAVLFAGLAGPGMLFYGLDVKYGLAEAPFFFVGGLLAVVGQRIPGLWRADLCLLGFMLNYAVSSWFGLWNLPIEWFTLPYIVIAAGRMSLPVVRDVGRLGDWSYGLYLYAFPIQQLVIQAWPQARYPVLLCVGLTVPVAFVSWHLVERWALAAGRRPAVVAAAG